MKKKKVERKAIEICQWFCSEEWIKSSWFERAAGTQNGITVQEDSLNQ